MKAKKFVMKKKFEGEPKTSDFEMVEIDLEPIKHGEILCAAEYLSVDPYMRLMMSSRPEGSDMIGHQVAKILESKNPKFPVGSYINGRFGWRTHTVLNPDLFVDDVRPYLIPDIGDLPLSLSVGMVGRPGNTAYFGLLDLCNPQPGETVVVTAAAGAVGSHVGQIARIKGCNVVGFAGSDKKCEWLMKELGFHHAFNYKSVDVSHALKEAAPQGVDCYFDNVGGDTSRKIMKHMNKFGRIAMCGDISGYNNDTPADVPISQLEIIRKDLKIQGLTVGRWSERWMEGIAQNIKWIQEGQIKYVEELTVGFSNMPDAFISMLKGGNTGKAVVKV